MSNIYHWRRTAGYRVKQIRKYQMYCIAWTPVACHAKMPPLRLGCGAPLRRMEDKIRTLCAQLLAEQDEAKLTLLIVELRNELHQHIERLRAKFANYPVIIERRNHFPVKSELIDLIDGALSAKAEGSEI